MGVCLFFFDSEGHIGLERKVTKLEAMVKMLQEDLKKVGEKSQHMIQYKHYGGGGGKITLMCFALILSPSIHTVELGADWIFILNRKYTAAAVKCCRCCFGSALLLFCLLLIQTQISLWSFKLHPLCSQACVFDLSWTKSVKQFFSKQSLKLRTLCSPTKSPLYTQIT